MKKMRDLQSVFEIPDDLPDDREGQERWVRSLATEIVDLVWRQPPKEDFDTVKEGVQMGCRFST